MLYELFHRSEVETFITNFLTGFATRKHIQVDDLFYLHIDAVVSDLPFHINSIDIPHEERLICLVSHISELQIKLKSVLKIAKEWPVPWSQNIEDLVVTCLRLPLPIGNNKDACAEIQNTINIMRVQVPFRCLLNKYRLTATKVQNYCGVVMALTRIIHVGNPEYYADCVELIKHTGIADEDKIKSLEFSYKLLRSQTAIDDLVVATWDRQLHKRLLARVIQEFKMVNILIIKYDKW
jgi:hypothetical protein